MTRSQALALTGPCALMLAVCGLWEIGQRVVDHVKARA